MNKRGRLPYLRDESTVKVLIAKEERRRVESTRFLVYYRAITTLAVALELRSNYCHTLSLQKPAESHDLESTGGDWEVCPVPSCYNDRRTIAIALAEAVEGVTLD